MAERVRRSEDEWRQRLQPDEYRVLRENHTENPWSGAYLETTAPGVYHCRACDAELFHSSTKFLAECGWLIFIEPIDPATVDLIKDRSIGMVQTRVRCSACLSHLGYHFENHPYQTNSLSLFFRPTVNIAQEAAETPVPDFEDGGDHAPVRIFLSSEALREEAEQAVASLLDAFKIDVRVVQDGDSWSHGLFIRAGQSGPLGDQLTKLERAIGLQTHLRTQPEVDERQGDVVAKLIASLESTPKAVIQIGSVLLVKNSSDLLVRNLTQGELALYERNPALFRDPVIVRMLLESFQREGGAAALKAAETIETGESSWDWS